MDSVSQTSVEGALEWPAVQVAWEGWLKDGWAVGEPAFLAAEANSPERDERYQLLRGTLALSPGLIAEGWAPAEKASGHMAGVIFEMVQGGLLALYHQEDPAVLPTMLVAEVGMWGAVLSSSLLLQTVGLNFIASLVTEGKNRQVTDSSVALSYVTAMMSLIASAGFEAYMNAIIKERLQTIPHPDAVQSSMKLLDWLRVSMLSVALAVLCQAYTGQMSGEQWRSLVENPNQLEDEALEQPLSAVGEYVHLLLLYLSLHLPKAATERLALVQVLEAHYDHQAQRPALLQLNTILRQAFADVPRPILQTFA